MTSVAPTTILSALTKQDLFKIASQKGISISEKSTKPKIVEAICTEIEDLGIKQLTNQLKKVQLEEIAEPLKIDLTSNGTNTVSKTVLSKRILEVMEIEGVERFLSKHADVDSLTSIVQALDEEPASKSKEKLVDQAVRLINLAGFQTYFGRFDTVFLQHLMGEMKLKFDTDSKQKIVYALATQTNARKESSSREIVFSKTKQPIKKGITFQDIYQHYLRDELFDWCKENDLKVSGNKKELINRILAFLDGDKENTMASNVKEVAKEKESTKKEKEATKKEKEAAKKEKEATKKEKEVAKEDKKRKTEEDEDQEPVKKGAKKGTKESSPKNSPKEAPKAEKKNSSKQPKEDSSSDEE